MIQLPLMKERASFSAWLRMGVFLALILTGLAIACFTSWGDLLDKEHLLPLVTELRSLWWAPLLLIGLYNLSVVGWPPGPMMVAGALFGPLYGTVYNVVGLFTAAASSYLIARLLGREFVQQIMGERMRSARNLFDRHGFWPLVQTRFLPFPFNVVNFGAALAGVRPGLFLASAAAGLFPSTLIHTCFIAALLESAGRQRVVLLVSYAAVFIVFNVLISAFWIKGENRKRFLSFGWLRAFLTGLIKRLDRYLRQRQGIFTYCDDPDCIFRVHVAPSQRPLVSSRGELPMGSRILELHFWNERIPPEPAGGDALGRGLKIYKLCRNSMKTLAIQLQCDERMAGVQAVGGLMPVFHEGHRNPGDTGLKRLGFHLTPFENVLGFWGRFGKQLHGRMMMWAFNPHTIKKRSLLRLGWVDCWMTTDELIQKYAPVLQKQAGK